MNGAGELAELENGQKIGRNPTRFKSLTRVYGVAMLDRREALCRGVAAEFSSSMSSRDGDAGGCLAPEERRTDILTVVRGLHWLLIHNNGLYHRQISPLTATRLKVHKK